MRRKTRKVETMEKVSWGQGCLIVLAVLAPSVRAGDGVLDPRLAPVPAVGRPKAGNQPPASASGMPAALPVQVPPSPAPGGAAGNASGPGITLSAVIQTALEANPDLRSAEERIRIADATLIKARADFYPKLTLTEAVVDTNIAGLAFFLEVNQRRLSLSQNFNNPGFVGNISTLLTLQYKLYTGGRRTAEALSAAEQRRAAAFALDATRNEMVYRVAEAYYRLLQTREIVKSRSAAVDQVKRHLTFVQSRYDNGTAVRSDVLTVDVRLAEAREGLITATNQAELTWLILENVTGRRFDHDVTPGNEPAPWTEHVDVIEAAVGEAIGRRPEIGAGQSDVRAAAHQIEAARAARRPTLDFIGNFSTFSLNRNSGGDGLFLGLIASLNLFDGHRLKAEVARASARERELEAQQQRLIMDVELEVRRAFVALRDAEGRLSVSGQAILQANQSLHEIEDRYNDDKATITQLIDAQVANINARVRRSSAEADVQIARAGLERVLGRLTQDPTH